MIWPAASITEDFRYDLQVMMYLTYLLPSALRSVKVHTYYTALKINRTRVDRTASVTCKSRLTTKTQPVCCSIFKYNSGYEQFMTIQTTFPCDFSQYKGTVVGVPWDIFITNHQNSSEFFINQILNPKK